MSAPAVADVTPFFHPGRYVPGLVWSTKEYDPCPPGLEATQGKGAKPQIYMPVSFGAHREYVDDKDGWQTVSYRKKGKKARRWRDVGPKEVATTEVADTTD